MKFVGKAGGSILNPFNYVQQNCGGYGHVRCDTCVSRYVSIPDQLGPLSISIYVPIWK